VAAVAITLCAAQPAFALSAAVTILPLVGGNPGALKMYEYIPTSVLGPNVLRPVVVVLHGCLQTAADFDDETGWTALADTAKVSLVFAEQQVANNSNKCFNWFEPGDIERAGGEAESIRNMVSTFKTNHNAIADTANSVYVSGFSAGGAMAMVMLATYPEVFKAGAVNSGLPYKCAKAPAVVFPAVPQTPAAMASACMSGTINNTPATWKTLADSGCGVPANGACAAALKPRLISFQAQQDGTVNINNQNEIMEQWTQYSTVSQTPAFTDTVPNGAGKPLYPRKYYGNRSSTPPVMTVTLTATLAQILAGTAPGHALSTDPAPAAFPCGTVAGGTYVKDYDMCTTYWTLKFWGY
jgi:poly(hydroxyalkanoate) depolymerase family esterase